MDNEEFQQLCTELRAKGFTDQNILDVIFKMFLDGDIRKVDLEKMANALGFKLSKSFLEIDAPDPYTLKHKK